MRLTTPPRITRGRWLALLILLTGLLPALLALDVGDPAPALKVGKWLNGDGVDPAKADGKTTYVVEFWATWCPPCKQSIPHLNKLRAKYLERHVVILGISNEDEKTVREFMKTTPMEYLVGVDDKEGTSVAYMAGIPGIPHAFLVGTDGKVVWHGHPLELDDVLDRVLSGTFNPEIPKLEAQLQKANEANDAEAFAATVDKLLALAPTTSRYYEMKLGVLQFKHADATAVKAVQQAWVKNCATDAAASLQAAAAILAGDHPDRELALAAARNAVKALETPNPEKDK